MTHFVRPQGLCETSTVGEGSRVWAFAHVLPGAVIGRDANICDHVFIENDVVVGDRVIRLGDIAPRGERNTLVVDLDSLLRVSSNPFFPYLIGRVEEGIAPAPPAR